MTFTLPNLPPSTFLLHPLTTTTKPSKLLFSFKPKTTVVTTRLTATPPRDRIIDFGKYKGRMLGTLPSTYLKWVSQNLRARDFEEWAELADQVLEDPIYKDRLEWEFAEKVLDGNNALSSSSISLGQMKSSNSVSELLEISERFGWDNEDKLGWSKIDFQFLGTSRGGRIPRLNEEKKKGRKEVLQKTMRVKKKEGKEEGEERRRKERREKLRLRSTAVSQPMMVNSCNNTGFRNEKIISSEKEKERIEDSRDEEEVYNPFPGRESLLKRVLNRRRKPV